MELATYFEDAKGVGVLSTADSSGKVNAAIYAKPHFMEDGTVAFIMRDRLTHANVNSNPHATFLFHESDSGYRGKRLYLRKVREEKESSLLYQIKRRENKNHSKDDKEPLFLVFFELEKELPLISRSGGNGE